ncbi:MAG: serine dehydratase beta chain [Bacteriovoracaceae bacterium]|nr:hypothetical protein [Bacteroidota bacterium]
MPEYISQHYLCWTDNDFDLIKVGPGPTGSHTIGPMKATYDFPQRIRLLPESILSSASTIEVIRYGSLIATSKGY